MDVVVAPATRDEQALVEALAQLYIYDLSAIVSVDVGDDGRYGALLPIGRYFAEPRRHAFVLRVGGNPAGFALVDERSRLSGDEGVRDMAEFFVMRRLRRHGVGQRAAAWLFDRFAGPWEVRQKQANEAATAFWRAAIGRYTKGRFEELVLDDERWRGPVQRFDSRSR